MKKLLLLILILSCAIYSFGQQKSPDKIDKVDKETQLREFLAKKHLILDDLGSQVKNIPFAAVRVFARYKIASWLWSAGKDDTGRAEQIAVDAVNDLYENKTEIPDTYFVH